MVRARCGRSAAGSRFCGTARTRPAATVQRSCGAAVSSTCWAPTTIGGGGSVAGGRISELRSPGWRPAAPRRTARWYPASPRPSMASARRGRLAAGSRCCGAARTLASGTTILLARGTYRLTRSLYIRGIHDVALRGDSDSRDDVVLIGPGMENASYGEVPYGVWAGDGVSDLLLANMTIREFYFHPIILNAGVVRPRVYNVHLIDAGQQFLKSNPDNTGRGNDS